MGLLAALGGLCEVPSADGVGEANTWCTGVGCVRGCVMGGELTSSGISTKSALSDAPSESSAGLLGPSSPLAPSYSETWLKLNEMGI